METKLSHLDEAGRPWMVDVGYKETSVRSAWACSLVYLPPELAKLLEKGEIQTKKGPVFATAILAGVMAAKKTSDLIPLCHSIPLEHCAITVEPREPEADGSRTLEVHCRVHTQAKTGVEMEALVGASLAALTLYDMGKAVSKGIVVKETRLLEKTGGVRGDYKA